MTKHGILQGKKRTSSEGGSKPSPGPG
jgi:hypothetical protein